MSEIEEKSMTGMVRKSRLKTRYEEEVLAGLMDRFGYRNKLQAPRPLKVVVNVGVGDGKEDAKLIDATVNELSRITGQKPAVRRAKRAIAAFRLREAEPIGCVVTLRRDRMWEFIDRFINAAVPRIRDFRGLSPTAFDGHGNYTVGIREQIIFPELSYDDIVRMRGMGITVATSARTDEEAHALLSALGFPFAES